MTDHLRRGKRPSFFVAPAGEAHAALPVAMPRTAGWIAGGFWGTLLFAAQTLENKLPKRLPGVRFPRGKREPPLVDIPNVREEKVLVF